MNKTILVAGTWGFEDDDWFRGGSTFWTEALKQGVDLPKATNPFEWCTGLEGLHGENAHWIAGAHALLWYCMAYGIKRPNIAAHSHGGQVAQISTLFGLEINELITIATPVRDDVQKQVVRSRIAHWRHIHTGVDDRMQILGELGGGGNPLKREMVLADENIDEPGQTHSGLLDPALWTARGWWERLKNEERIFT
jgi:hypothetical protein